MQFRKLNRKKTASFVALDLREGNVYWRIFHSFVHLHSFVVVVVVVECWLELF